MPIEDQISDLQASVTALLAAVSVKRTELDLAVTTSQAALTNATTAANTAQAALDAALAIPEVADVVALNAAVADAEAAAAAALVSRDQAVAAAALYPALTGQALGVPRVNAGATGLEFRSPTNLRSDLGLATTSAVTFGSLSLGPVATKTANFTLSATENVVINNKSGSACVVTLPAASLHSGRILFFVNGANGQALTSASANVIPITGAAAATAITPAGVGKYAQLVSNGTNWVVVSASYELPSLAVANMLASAVRTSAEGLSTPLDTELATAAWVEDYARDVVPYNCIINGQGRVNARGYVSGTATTVANQYAIDRWVVIVSGQSLVFTGTQDRRIMTAPAGGVEQHVEDINIQGGTYVLNWFGTATATVNGTARAKGEPFTLPAGTQADVRFFNGTFTDVQLELGSVPSRYQYMTLQEEQKRCERYYTTTVTSARFWAAAAGHLMGVPITWRTVMRTTPAVTRTGTFVNTTTPTVANIGSTGARFGIQSSAAGDCYALDQIITADAEI